MSEIKLIVPGPFAGPPNILDSSDGRELVLRYDVEIWCKENLRDNTYPGGRGSAGYYVGFRNQEDADTFKARWLS